MPILNYQSPPTSNPDPDGRPEVLPPDGVLQRRGPTIQVSIALARSFAEVLLQHGGIVPEPVAGWALVDTGATSTCIDRTAAEQMGLPVVDVARMASA